MTPDKSALPEKEEIRKIPKADRLLAVADSTGFVKRLGHAPVMEEVRSTLEQVRASVLAGDACPTPTSIEATLLERLEGKAKGSLRRVVNATGVVIHTNLGRAPLSNQALAAMAEVGGGYSNLEYDLAAGVRRVKLPAYRMPDVPKRAAGYYADHWVPLVDADKLTKMRAKSGDRGLSSEAAQRSRLDSAGDDSITMRDDSAPRTISSMQTGQAVGMQTLDMALLELVNKALVTREEAQSRTLTPNLFGPAIAAADAKPGQPRFQRPMTGRA